MSPMTTVDESRFPKFCFRIDPELRAWLNERAALEHRSVSNLVKYAILQYLASNP